MTTEANTTNDTPLFRGDANKPRPHHETLRDFKKGKHSLQQTGKVLARLRGDHGATARFQHLHVARLVNSLHERDITIARSSAQAERAARERHPFDTRRADLEPALGWAGEIETLVMWPNGSCC